MNKLFIIGNGFDIAHDIPSRYKDFKKYCMLYLSEMYDKLNRYYDDSEKLWSDFEREMPNINKNALFDWAIINNDGWNKNSKDYYRFVDDVRNEVDYVEGIKIDFTEWIQSIKFDNVKRKYKLSKDDFYLTFNYTMTLENVYVIPKDNICHIHGKVDENFPQLIIGHNMKNSEVDEMFNSDNDLENEVCTEVANMVKGWRKDTESIINKNIGFFKRLNAIESIYIFGHSMGDTDLPYFEALKNYAHKCRKWYISVFGIDDLKRKERVIRLLGLVNVEFVHLDDFLITKEVNMF